eukprot:649020-Rhodomonas_salina.1
MGGRKREEGREGEGSRKDPGTWPQLPESGAATCRSACEAMCTAPSVLVSTAAINGSITSINGSVTSINGSITSINSSIVSRRTASRQKRRRITAVNGSIASINGSTAPILGSAAGGGRGRPAASTLRAPESGRNEKLPAGASEGEWEREEHVGPRGVAWGQ